MSRALGRQGDVTASVGTVFFTGATSGTWTAGSVSVTTSDALRSDGSLAATEATCDFTFSGSNGTSPVAGSSTVKLSPSTRAIRVGGRHPLVDGDAATDAYGNSLQVSSSASVRTG